jgi:hypothetical protein
MRLPLAQLVSYPDSRRLEVPSNHNIRRRLLNLNHNSMIKLKTISFPITHLLGGTSFKRVNPDVAPTTDIMHVTSYFGQVAKTLQMFFLYNTVKEIFLTN